MAHMMEGTEAGAVTDVPPMRVGVARLNLSWKLPGETGAPVILYSQSKGIGQKGLEHRRCQLG